LLKFIEVTFLTVSVRKVATTEDQVAKGLKAKTAIGMVVRRDQKIELMDFRMKIQLELCSSTSCVKVPGTISRQNIRDVNCERTGQKK